MKNVGAAAFQGCDSLRSVKLNEGLETLGEKEVVNGEEEEGHAFAQSGLTNIVLPSTLREIPQNTFWECRAFKNVTFAEGLQKIGVGAF